MSQWQPQQYDAPVQAAPAPAAAQKRKPSALLGCLTLLGIAAVIGIVIAVATSGSGGGSSFRATTAGFTVINPGDVAVTVHVTNTGKTAATPTCTVNVSDPAGSYTGSDEGTLTSPVQPGQTATYVDNVSVGNNGAQYVTRATVSC